MHTRTSYDSGLASKNRRDREFLLGKELVLCESFVFLCHWILETLGEGSRLKVWSRRHGKGLVARLNA